MYKNHCELLCWFSLQPDLHHTGENQPVSARSTIGDFDLVQKGLVSKASWQRSPLQAVPVGCIEKFDHHPKNLDERREYQIEPKFTMDDRSRRSNDGREAC